MFTIFAFLFVLGVLIFIHELGHFLAAKWMGVRVERFSLGFPPRMIGKKIGETDYCISWIPLGGYVKLAGMIDEGLSGKITGAPWEYHSRPPWQRFIIIFAGPAMNYLLALAIFAGLIYVNGVSVPVGATIGDVKPGMPADRAGLKPGDRVIRIHDRPVKRWDDFIDHVQAHPGQQIPVTVLRGRDTLTLAITPKAEARLSTGAVGVRPLVHTRTVGLPTALYLGFKQTLTLTFMAGEAIYHMVSGRESVKEGLAGPVGIARMVGEAARLGMTPLFGFIGLLSLQLAFLNLLPIPALDGGHIALLLTEGVLRRPLSLKAKLVFQQIGMVLLLALMAFIVFNDIRKLL